jgi:hypothetical protein
MLALSDDQLDTVRRFASPLHPNDRSTYLQRVTELLKDQVIGDGLLHRVCERAQLELRRPPALDPRGSISKYSR